MIITGRHAPQGEPIVASQFNILTRDCCCPNTRSEIWADACPGGASQEFVMDLDPSTNVWRALPIAASEATTLDLHLALLSMSFMELRSGCFNPLSALAAGVVCVIVLSPEA